MKRMTTSLIATAVILVIGTFALWTLFTAPRPEPSAPPVTGPATSGPETAPAAFGAALNLYMSEPDRLPSEAGRFLHKLIRASRDSGDGTESYIYGGSRK